MTIYSTHCYFPWITKNKEKNILMDLVLKTFKNLWLWWFEWNKPSKTFGEIDRPKKTFKNLRRDFSDLRPCLILTDCLTKERGPWCLDWLSLENNLPCNMLSSQQDQVSLNLPGKNYLVIKHIWLQSWLQLAMSVHCNPTLQL